MLSEMSHTPCQQIKGMRETSRSSGDGSVKGGRGSEWTKDGGSCRSDVVFQRAWEYFQGQRMAHLRESGADDGAGSKGRRAARCLKAAAGFEAGVEAAPVALGLEKKEVRLFCFRDSVDGLFFGAMVEVWWRWRVGDLAQTRWYLFGFTFPRSSNRLHSDSDSFSISL